MAPSEPHWILHVWVLFFALLHRVFCLLPAPHNLTIVSFNLEHKLFWTPGLGTPAYARFRVQNYRNRKNSWLPVLNCSDLSAGESCDLTTTFKNSFYYSSARVQAFTPDQESNWTTSKLFNPLTDTTLGPAVVELTGCGNCLVLKLSPPASRAPRKLELFFSHFIVNVSRTRDKTQFVIRASSGENLINYLEPGAEYCVTVIPVTNLMNPVVPSGPHCSYTSPAPVSTVTVFVAALCALVLLVALLSMVLIHSCRRGVLHTFLQRTLFWSSSPASAVPGGLSVASVHDLESHSSTLQVRLCRRSPEEAADVWEVLTGEGPCRCSSEHFY